jgi:hypothetical protein
MPPELWWTEAVEGVQVGQPEDIEAAPGMTAGVRRAIHVIGTVLVVVVVPVVLMDALVGGFGADAMFLGLVYGVLGSKLGGTQRMLTLAPLVGCAAGLGAFTAYGWTWALLLGLLGVVAGAGTWGWLPPLLMPAFAATFATPVTSGRHAVAYGVIAGTATLYGVVLARRFKAPAVVEAQRVFPAQAVMMAVVLGALLAGSSAIGVAFGWSEPYWVPEPILLLIVYVIQGKRERIREKALGTALGAVAVVPVAIAAAPQWVITVIASGSYVLALTQYKKSYWIYYSLYTFAFVLALSSPGNVATEAAQRGTEILIGIGLLIIGLAVVHALGGWLAKRYPEPLLA